MFVFSLSLIVPLHNFVRLLFPFDPLAFRIFCECQILQSLHVLQILTLSIVIIPPVLTFMSKNRSPFEKKARTSQTVLTLTFPHSPTAIAVQTRCQVCFQGTVFFSNQSLVA